MMNVYRDDNGKPVLVGECDLTLPSHGPLPKRTEPKERPFVPNKFGEH